VTISLADPDGLVDPEVHGAGEAHALWRWMRANSPVHRHEPTQLPGFWSVSRYADVRAVYSDASTFSSARGVLLRPLEHGEDPGGGLTLALTDPPRHRQMRALIAEAFGVRHARALEEAMTADVRALLRRCVDVDGCDFAHDVAARLSIHLVCRLLDIPGGDIEKIFIWTHEAFEAGKPLTSHLDIMRYFIGLMHDRMRQETADDVAGMFSNGLVDDELLSETEILLNFENLVGATENAGLSVAAAVQALLEHPDQWRALRQDRDLLPTAIEEMLRWTSSAVHSMRTATRDVDLGGRRIAAGDRVVLWIPSANRDESVFAEPDRFDLARRPNRHIALGFGVHVCIGGLLARTQMRILLTELLDLAAEIEPTGPVVPLRSIAVRGPAHLPIRIVPK
jgi:cytochrome P450